MKFEELNLKHELIENLNKLNYKKPTKIQSKVIPKILKKIDILGLAQTGTGKTAAFSLPILNMILENPKNQELKKPRAIILAPTRELTTQIQNAISDFANHTNISSLPLHGGVDFIKQIKELNEKSFDIIIGTPKRILDLILKKHIELEEIEFFVIDEADKIIEEGSKFDLKEIRKRLPRRKQSMFFSATMSEEIEEIVKEILINPAKIEIKEQINLDLIENQVYFVKKENKYKLLLDLLAKKELKSAMIFTNTKSEADNLVRFLNNNKIHSEVLHSAKSDVHRKKVIEHLKTRFTKYLITTELGSRGIDVENLTNVINFDLPLKTQDFVHRVGRCGRAERKGTSFSLCSAEERNSLEKIEKLINSKLIEKTSNYHCQKSKIATGKDAKPLSKKDRERKKWKKKK